MQAKDERKTEMPASERKKTRGGKTGACIEKWRDKVLWQSLAVSGNPVLAKTLQNLFLKLWCLKIHCSRQSGGPFAGSQKAAATSQFLRLGRVTQ